MKRPSRGIVLVIVLITIAILALAAYTFAELMITQREAAEYAGQQAQARMLVDSGVEAARTFLMQDPLLQMEMGGHYDNPAAFQAQLVADDPDPNLRGRFTLLAPMMDDQGYLAGVRFGLENESARLNLNALPWIEKQPLMEGVGRNLLMGLPGMTEETADAILDYIDEDIEPREFGAEDEYYLSLDPPYAPKNAPLDTVEELLLVRGVTPQLLFGPDANRNGMLDPHEMTDAALAESIDGSMDRGWSGYLTLWSMERNVNQQGLPRIHVNQDDLQQLYTDLCTVFDEEWARFIVAYRQYEAPRGGRSGGDSGGDSGNETKPLSELPFDPAQPAKRKISRVLDLIGAQIHVPQNDPGGSRGRGGDQGGRGGEQGGRGDRGGDQQNRVTIYESPFPNDPVAMAGYLHLLLDEVSVNANPWIPGRLNVNQAPRTLLLGVPGMTEEIVDAIIANRQMEDTGEDPNRRFETWLLTSGIVTLDEMKPLSVLLTAGGDVHRTQVVGYFEDGGAAARAEVVIDATQSTPRILFWRDLSQLGRGYPLELLGVQTGELP